MGVAQEVDTITVDVVSDLANLEPRNAQTVRTRGYYAHGDGGANEYYYDYTSAATVDGGFVLNGPGGTGRFLAVDQTVANVRQFGAYGDNSNDDTTTIQAAIDSGTSVYFPKGDYRITDTLLLKRGGCHLYGEGHNVSRLYYVNAAGGVAISGDSNKQASLTTYDHCSIKGISMSSTAAATDPSVYLDITSFAYSTFDLHVQTRRVNGVCVYGQGNAGSSPYYNVITGSFFGNSDYTQTALQFAQGAWTGGSNGPNANIIGPIKRAAGLAHIMDIQAGNGNLITNVNGESIGTSYFKINDNAAVLTSTSTGSNTQNTLNDTGQAWTVNDYSSDAVKITGGTGSGQVRFISGNTATALTISEPWATLPDATSTYEIYEGKGIENKFAFIRAEGLASNNPDFFDVKPGGSLNTASNILSQSLGSGLYVRDDSGDARNSWYGGQKVVFTESIINPGPSANIELYPRNSVFGGMKPAGNYVVEWLKVATTSTGGGDTVTVTLDVGGTATATGSDMTLVANVANGSAISTALPASTDKISRDGTNRSVFVNLQTGASFSTTVDVQVTWCVTLI